MRHLQGQAREQLSLLPASVDDYIEPNHLVRVIDSFCNQLNIQELGFEKAITAHTGRKPYHPADLLKQFIYGYFNQITSARRLEKESKRNVELIWLLKGLTPDFKTLCDFRRQNAQAIKQANQSLIQFCKTLSLLNATELALDGSKIHSAASQDQVITPNQLSKQQDRLDKKLDDYLDQLEQNDTQDLEAIESELSEEEQKQRIQKALEILNNQKDKISDYQDFLKSNNLNQFCLTEPDAKRMRSGRGRMIVGYNLQNVVDAKHQLIVTSELTQENTDNQQLYPMGLEAKALLKQKNINLLADAGYSNGEQLQHCTDKNITPYVALNRSENTQGDYYSKDAFEYLPEQNAYQCPQGKMLQYKTLNTKKKMYLYQAKDCAACAQKAKCTASQTRWVSRHFYEEAFKQTQQRTTPKHMRKRMAIVEPVFARIKAMMGNGRLRSWGLKAAKSEIGMCVLAHNLQRAMNVLGNERIMQELAKT